MDSFVVFALAVSVSLVSAPTSATPAAFGSPVEQAAPAGAAEAEPGSFPDRWINGDDCETEPAIQVHAYNRDFFILRQSLCTSFEAPFIYLIFGNKKVLLVDTGAGKIEIQDAVAGVIDEWLASSGQSSIELVVVHSHGHTDHTAGDAQFADQPNTTLVPASVPDLQRFFGIAQWPTDIVSYDLGGRILDIIPIPGHHDSHIALYDRRTQLLLTGDTLYPGRLYVLGAVSKGQWPIYQASIKRLVDFSAAHPVTYILGTHIEMTNEPGGQQMLGTRNHPNEHPLQLRLEHLQELHRSLIEIGDTPQVQIHDHFVIIPMN